MKKHISVLIVSVIICVVVWYVISTHDKVRRTTAPHTAPASGMALSKQTETSAQKAVKSPVRRAPEIVAPSGYINTDGVTLSHATKTHRVVLLHFWTYGCINCQRTLGHINDWYEQYHADGLEVIGVHYPEFSYERKPENVKAFVIKNHITYPVVLDNHGTTWRAYDNRYWPHRYLIDAHGQIVYDHIGEGAYAETEAKIREMLYNRE